MAPIEVPDELREIAGNFVELQGARHQADYDLGDSFRRKEALQFHEMARASIKDYWPEVSDHDATRFFLVSLVTWPEVKR